jgi:mercuric ion transport protein
MKIEVLYFDECPNHQSTVERVKEVLQEENLAADLVEVNVGDDATARSVGFLGSPTVRVDGLDVEPSARSSKEFGLMCRTYAEGNRRVGVPPRELIRTALREAAGAQPAHDCCQVPAAPTQAVLQNSAAPKRKWLLGGSVAAAVAASLCCILPILTAVTGVGVLAAGAKFESWRPYLLGVTGLLLGTGLFLAYRDYKKACAPGSLCATKPMSRWNLAALGLLAVLVAGLAAFPYYSGAVAQAVVGNPVPRITAGAALTTVTFQIPDMDCPACAVSLAATFKRLPGVAEAKLDVENRKAVVAFDPTSQSVPALEKVISEAGFHVASKSVL